MTARLVLVADGDAVALAQAGAALGEAGYAVISASSGRQALKKAIANPPDLLITEILMSDGDGIELITALKEKAPDIRIIAIAERRFLGGLDLLDLASKLGADAILDKPLKAANLLGVVSAILGLRDGPG